MSYQVLARKWRPKTFTEMVGQEHVLKALVNALDDDRLHHAYLFTGTRGVGKTSIARLFAKSLNCQDGVSSQPCGQCGACVEIAEGRFVDLIEVDAASRTKVEDTRELLENVQYAPTHGRYKVYLIDEVHMLSTHSFNALLKTLEEPPPHVKFLLATTDPQKLPVTILSRCLQFNLKNMIPQRIVEHLQHVLGQEGISYEEPALWLLARSADGSMRDAMSLTDQAIAFGAGEVNEADVRAMLGTIDQRLVYRMLEHLAASDIAALLQTVEELAQFSPDYDTVLGDLISLLHRIAIAQAIPDGVDNSLGDQQQVEQLAGQMTAEDVQLYYQVALMGRKDLPYVPDAREGLEMVLLRMAAFRPASSAAPSNAGQGPAAVAPSQPSVPVSEPSAPQVPPMPESAPASAPVQTAPVSEPMAPPVAPPAPAPAPAPMQPPVRSAPPADDPPPWDEDNMPPGPDDSYGAPPAKKSEPLSGAAMAAPVVEPVAMARAAAMSAVSSMPPVVEPISQPQPVLAPVKGGMPEAAIYRDPGKMHAIDPDGSTLTMAQMTPAHWVPLQQQLGLTGMTESLAASVSLEQIVSYLLVFHYTENQRAVLTEVHRERIAGALEHYFSATLRVEFTESRQTQETPFEYLQRKKAERMARAVVDMQNDPVVQRLISQFDGRLELDTVLPIDPN